MNRLPLVVMCAGFASCATLNTGNNTPSRVSPHYDAIGDSHGIRPFLYGKGTVLELPGKALWLTVTDENGVTVPHEVIGKHVRVARRLGELQVQYNLSSARFKLAAGVETKQAAAPTPAPSQLAPSLQTEPIRLQATLANTTTTLDPAAPPKLASNAQLWKIAEHQLSELKTALHKASMSDGERAELEAKIQAFERDFQQAAKVVISVRFDRERTAFSIHPSLEAALIPAALTSSAIDVRGRTDSKVAGPADASIAQARADAATAFLLSRGVTRDKISVSSLPAGDRVAPSSTKEGRALNRRVEIELRSGEQG
jgi:flagellar motor protein MotB